MKRLFDYRLWAMVTILSLPQSLLAHSGHGVMEGNSLVHYLLSPSHAITLGVIVLGVLAFFGWKRFATQKKR